MVILCTYCDLLWSAVDFFLQYEACNVENREERRFVFDHLVVLPLRFDILFILMYNTLTQTWTHVLLC